MKKMLLGLALVVGLMVARAEDKGMLHEGLQGGAEFDEPRVSSRVALVIGNGKYSEVSPLWAPVEDAKAWAGALEEGGFEVLTCYECTREKMKKIQKEFGAKIVEGGEAFLFYSGHGAEQDDRNVLFPVDAEIENCGDIDDWAISLNSLLGTMERARVKVVVLDACRNSPFPSCTKSSGGIFGEQVVPEGTLIAYATTRGYSAQDGEGKLSPFSKVLLPLARTPGLPFTDALQLARAGIQAIAPDQRPYDSNTIAGAPWVMIPGPHPNVQAEIVREEERRRAEADQRWAEIAIHPAGTNRYHMVVNFLATYGGSGASSVILANRELQGASPVGSSTGGAGYLLDAPGGVEAPATGGPTGRVRRFLEGTDEEIRMLELSPGSFTMGLSGSDGSGARPIRVHVLEPFFLSETELTWGQWRRVLEEARAREIADAWDLPTSMPLGDQPANGPVVGMSWCEAIRFVNIASARFGRTPMYEIAESCAGPGSVRLVQGAERPGFRLPMDAQWEYAARAEEPYQARTGGALEAGCPNPHFAGAVDTTPAELVEPAPSACGEGRDRIQSVRSSSVNRFGFFDLLWNAREWVEDHEYVQISIRSWPTLSVMASRAEYFPAGVQDLALSALTSPIRARRVARGAEPSDELPDHSMPIRVLKKSGTFNKDIGFRLMLMEE